MTLNRYTIIAFALFSSLLPFIARAQESSSDVKTKTIHQIMEGINAGNRLSQSPDELQAQFKNNAFGLAPSKNKRMMNQFGKAFTSDSLLSEARSIFMQQYKPAYADSIVEWLSTEPTQSVMEAEKEFYTLHGSRKRVVAMYELEQNPADEARLKLIRSLNEATSASESTVESFATIFRSLVSAFSLISDKQTFEKAQIEAIVSNYRMQIQSQVEDEIINQFQAMYYGLENETLGNYISFYRTDSGNWLSQTMNQAKQSAYEDAARRFVSLVKSIKSTE